LVPKKRFFMNGETEGYMSETLNGNGIHHYHRSELTREVLSKKSNFLERWALLLFLGLLLIVVGIAWIIDYPDIIETRATLMADNEPKEIMAWQDGRLVDLFVQNDQQVVEKQVIGWVESTASHQEVLELSQKLDSSMQRLANGNYRQSAALFNGHYHNLGELQNNYQQFITSWQQFRDYQVNGFYKQKKAFLENDILVLGKMQEALLQQQQISEQNLQLAQESFDMNNLLLKEKVISQEDFRKEKSLLFGKQLSLPQIKVTRLSYENQEREKQKELEQLDHDMQQQKIIFQQALLTLKSAVADWIRKYVLLAPVSGKIVFLAPLQKNQFIHQGKIMGYVNPPNTRYYVELNLPQSNFGKIDTGFQVQIRFDAYPYEEFGTLNGKLNYISKVPSDSGFLGIVDFGSSLLSSYKKVLPYKSRLQARALVITRNTKLLTRIYYSIIKGTSLNK
jgi:multidrug resistance efflux pump